MTCTKSCINKCVHRPITDKKTGLCWQAAHFGLSCLFFSLLIAFVFICIHWDTLKSKKHCICNTYLSTLFWLSARMIQRKNTVYTLLSYMRRSDSTQQNQISSAETKLSSANFSMRQKISGTTEMVLWWSLCVKAQPAFFSTRPFTSI